MKHMAFGITLALMAPAAQAGEVIAALGGSDISLDTARATGVAELSYRFGKPDEAFAPEASIVAFDAGYAYVGAGMNARQTISGPWFAEGGAQLGGVFDDGGDVDPALRVSLGIGRDLGKGVSASLGVARIVTDDATLDSATLRLHMKM